MKKRGRVLIYDIAILEIVLLVSMSFAISFIFSGNLVSAQVPSILNNPSGSVSNAISENFWTTKTPWKVTIGENPAEFIGYKEATMKIGGEIQKSYYGIKPDGSFVNLGTNEQGANFVEEAIKGGVKLESGIPSVLQPKTGVDANLGLTKWTIDWWSPSANFLTAHLIEGVVWGGIVALAIKFIGPALGLDEKAADAAALAAFSGIIAGKGVYGLVGPQGWWAPASGKVLGFINPTLFSVGIGALIAFGIFAATYTKEKKKLVKFDCLPFEPPLGGAKCEECNKDPFRPCSEYRCRSLGQACQLLNPGTNEERCAWVNRNDINSPIIEPWKDALKPKDENLKYVPDNAIRPPNRGVKIVKGNADCLKAFTKLEFGITTNEPSQCKIDYNVNKSFDEMEFFVGGSNYYRYNHTEKMRLPAPDTGGGNIAPELKNDGTFSLFVQCQDANENKNVDKFVFNFCVDKSPDTTAPIIEGTSIRSGGFVRFKAETVPIEVYVNEPSECKWSREPKGYDQMENKMSCATETFQINANLNYVCKGNLTGIKDQDDNKFYFKCKDKPEKPDKERNVMTQSRELILKGSQPLNIANIGPRGTIFGKTSTVSVPLTVKTEDGAEEGKAICYFSNTGKSESYIAMFETNAFEHKQNLDLIKGSYKYFFRCIDAGGNSAENNTEFRVEIDQDAPLITRAYRENALKIVTNEDAECVYDFKSCNYDFDDGLKMDYSNPSIRNNHYAEWKADGVYYIKCSDLNGNKPLPNECSIVVRAVEVG